MTTGYNVSALIGMRKPKFRNSGDKLAYALHTVILAQGFHLYATGALAFLDDALSASSIVDVDGWNEFEDKYAFVFLNPKHESQNKLLVKCYVENTKQISVEAVAAANSSQPVYLTINIDDFIEENYDPKSMMYGEQFKNLDNLISLINNHILIKLLNWFPEPISNITKYDISTRLKFSPNPDIDISTTTGTRKNMPPRRNNHLYKCWHQSLESKFAKMRLVEMKKKRKKKKVKSASVSKPYKRRSVKNNKKNRSVRGASKIKHRGVTLYDLPLDIYENMKEAVGIIEHLESFKDDKKAMEDLERCEYYIATLSSDHKARNLPTDWTYNRATAREDVSKCYWEKVSYFES